MVAPEIRRRPQAAAADFGSDLAPILRRVYAARGLSCRADLDLSLDRLLPVSSLESVEAGARLLASHQHCGRVLVVGDFDADGATASALMVRALRALGFAHVDFLVPNRFRFGYGLTPEIVALAATRRPSLIVTVDNGVSSVEGVAALARVLERPDFRASDLLDLVALGTVADMVPLDRNNRVLVEQGLRRIRTGRRVPGIRAPLESGGPRPARP